MGEISFEHLLINPFGRWCEKSNTSDIEYDIFAFEITTLGNPFCFATRYCYCRHNGCNLQSSTDMNFVDIDLWPEEEECVPKLNRLREQEKVWGKVWNETYYTHYGLLGSPLQGTA